MTRKEISNCLGDHPRRNTLIYESTYKVYTLAIGGNSRSVSVHWDLSLVRRHQNATFCHQKVATRSRSVSVQSDLSYDASRAHRRGRGDKTKIDIFWACHHEAYSALRTIRMLTKLCW